MPEGEEVAAGVGICRDEVGAGLRSGRGGHLSMVAEGLLRCRIVLLLLLRDGEW
jgi:hypothetical protein